MQNYRRVGKYDISTRCYLTYPCKHNVKIIHDDDDDFEYNNNKKKPKLMSGVDIYCMLLKDNITDSHFEYSDYVRKRDHPSKEELEEREILRIKVENMKEEARVRKEEQERVTQKYKASSRLERLRLANNVL